MKKIGLFLCFLGISFFLSGCLTISKFEPSALLDVGKNLFSMATLSESDINHLATQSAKELDAENRVASSQSQYAKRLKRLVRQHHSEDDLNLDFKVYLDQTINAFAMPNGTIRIYSGLMDKMTDQEILYVIGHEIGHVKYGHTKEKMQIAYAASAGKKLLSAYDSRIGQLASGKVGLILEKFINAQFSQSEEKEADDYSFQFMKKHQYQAKAAITALNKLADLGGNSNSFVTAFLSSHPSPRARAERLQAQL